MPEMGTWMDSDDEDAPTILTASATATTTTTTTTTTDAGVEPDSREEAAPVSASVGTGEDDTDEKFGEKVIDVSLFGSTVQVLTQPKSLLEAGVYWSCNDKAASFIEEQVNFADGPRVLELGAGTGALSVCAVKAGASKVVCTDLEPVLDLIRGNFVKNGVDIDLHTVASVMPLEWGDEAQLSSILGNEGAAGAGGAAGRSGQTKARAFDLVVAIETVYWGGWDLLSVDTRVSLLDTIQAVSGPDTVTVLAFTLRDAGREKTLLQWAEERFAVTYSASTKAFKDLEEGDVVLAALRSKLEPCSSNIPCTFYPQAVSRGHVDCLRSLARQGKDEGGATIHDLDPDSGENLLHDAVEANQSKSLVFLLTKGVSCSVKAEDEDGHTPLQRAKAMGAARCAKMLELAESKQKATVDWNDWGVV